jgi:hypothetical protein
VERGRGGRDRPNLELADQAGAVLDAGGSTSDAAEALKAGSPVELQYDARIVRFRLPGGRPMWLGDADDLDSQNAAISTSASQVVAAPMKYHPGRS